MALHEIKKQVVMMLQNFLTLDTPERFEALGFLQNCVDEFGLNVSKEAEGSTPDKVNSSIQNFSPESGSDDEDKITPKAKLISEPDISYMYYNSRREGNTVAEQSTPTDLSTTNRSNDSLEKIQPAQVNAEISKKKYCEEKSDTDKEEQKNEKQRVTRKSVRCWNKTQTEHDVDTTTKDTSSTENKKIQRLKKLYDINVDENKEEEDGCILKCPGCPMICESKPILLLHFKSHSKAVMSCRMCRLYFSDVLHFWRHRVNGKCKLSQLVCSECGEKFKYRRHYQKHVLGHNDNNCKYCDEKFSTWMYYKNHLKKVHPDIKVERDLIPCKYCTMSFHRHIGLYNHYRMKHSKGKFVCLSCGALLPTKEKHKEHSLIHESEKKWKCKICKMKFYRRQQLLLHVSLHKLGIYKCLTCKITVTSKADLSKHKKEGHEVKGLEPKFDCQVCHKVFPTMVSLRNHSATHSKEKKYYCKYCVKNFSTLNSFLKHQKRKSHFEKAQVVIPESKYEKVYEDKLICESCGKQYKTQTELRWHLRVHKGIHKCEECGKTFTLKINLTKHTKLHRNPTRVICELCGDTFNQMSALNEHNLLKHSDVRNAKCDKCGKTFKRNSELNRHMRIHEFKRPYVCYCGQAYKQSAHLRHHQKTVHGKVSHQSSQTATQPKEPPPPIMEPQHYPNNETDGMFNRTVIDRRKSTYVTSEHGTLLALDNLEHAENPSDYRPTHGYDSMQLAENKVSYVPTDYTHNQMQTVVTYEELQFGPPPTHKRELVFTSPAVDLSMVAIPEVVHGELALQENHRPVTVEQYNKIPDDTSQIQLLNLSEHIVQEYLLNLP